MPPVYVASLLGVLLVLLLARVLAPLPVGRWAAPLSRRQALLVVVGGVGLVLHCVAMFATPFAVAVTGPGGLVAVVDALGPASVVAYVVPALLLLVGLVRPHPVGAAVVALTLLAVGLTMYDGGPVPVHLAALFTAVTVIALVLAALVPGVARPDRA